jgi:hypothetical protein
MMGGREDGCVSKVLSGIQQMSVSVRPVILLAARVLKLFEAASGELFGCRQQNIGMLFFEVSPTIVLSSECFPALHTLERGFLVDNLDMSSEILCNCKTSTALTGCMFALEDTIVGFFVLSRCRVSESLIDFGTFELCIRPIHLNVDRITQVLQNIHG